jgi:hypothetical protein
MSDRDYALHISLYTDEISDLPLILTEATKSLKKSIRLKTIKPEEQVEDAFCAGEFAYKMVELFNLANRKTPLGLRYDSTFECGDCGGKFEIPNAPQHRIYWTCPWCDEKGEYHWR